MKTIISLIFALATKLCFASYEVRSSQLNFASTGTVTSSISYPATGNLGFLFYNPDASPIPAAYMGVWGNEFTITGTPKTLNLSSTFYDWLGDNYMTLDTGNASIAAVNARIDTTNAAAFSGAYSALSGKPTLFSGAYADLSGKPSLFSGNYADLAGLPTLFNGAYSSLTGTPTIPTNTNQLTNGSGFITGIASGNVTAALGFTPYNSTNPNGYTSNTGTVTSIVAGTGLSGGTITTSGTISLPNTGTSGTYGIVTTDSQGRVTTGKRQETYSGTTNASGIYAVTFGTTYSVAPNIQINPISGNNKETAITTITTTGFSIYVQLRGDVLGLLPSYSNVSGRAVDVLITEK